MLLDTVKSFAEIFEDEMVEKFPDVKLLTREHLRKITRPSDKDKKKSLAYFFMSSIYYDNTTKSWNEAKAKIDKAVDTKKRALEEIVNNFECGRERCGDDMNNYSSVDYGNSIVNKGLISHGTHVAGIIGLEHVEGVNAQGVADVELMILRINGEGDEYDKDVARAIVYAADNGAQVINMSFGKDFSPNKKWVDNALKYADKKGVLMVHAAGNSYKDIDVHTIYPSRFTKRHEIKNYINVGAVDPSGNPAKFSCYGAKNVDLFAPGVMIYSSIPNDKYKKQNGTSMAAPIVSGIAAIIWNYFPKLTASQVKDAIIGSIAKREDIVALPSDPRSIMSKTEKKPFSVLCSSGGVISAYEAVKRAADIYDKNKY